MVLYCNGAASGPFQSIQEDAGSPKAVSVGCDSGYLGMFCCFGHRQT